jgi:hypothetical protein
MGHPLSFGGQVTRSMAVSSSRSGRSSAFPCSWLLCTVILPLALGAAIYLSARNSAPQLVNALPDLLQSALSTWRQDVSPTRLPDWLLFNLPDALWTFAFTSAVFLLWRKSSKTSVCFILVAVLFFSVALETFQYFNIVAGTFDPKDILASIIAWATAVCLSKCPKERSTCS